MAPQEHQILAQVQKAAGEVQDFLGGIWNALRSPKDQSEDDKTHKGMSSRGAIAAREAAKLTRLHQANETEVEYQNRLSEASEQMLERLSMDTRAESFEAEPEHLEQLVESADSDTPTNKSDVVVASANFYVEKHASKRSSKQASSKRTSTKSASTKLESVRVNSTRTSTNKHTSIKTDISTSKRTSTSKRSSKHGSSRSSKIDPAKAWDSTPAQLSATVSSDGSTKLINEYEAAVVSDRLWAAEAIVLKFRNVALEGDKTMSSTATESVRKYVKANSDRLGHTCREAVEVRELLTEIKGNEGWTRTKNTRGVQVFYKKKPDSPLQYTKVATTFRPDAGESIQELFVKICALFKEGDLMAKWFPRKLLNGNEILNNLSPLSYVSRMTIHPPMILGKREAFLHGRGYDLTQEEGAVVIAYGSIDDNKSPVFELPPKDSKYTRMVVRGCYYMEIKEECVVFTSTQMLDLKVKFLPPMVLNLLSGGKLPLEYNTSMTKTLQGFKNSEYQDRVNANPGFYEDMNERLVAAVANGRQVAL